MWETVKAPKFKMEGSYSRGFSVIEKKVCARVHLHLENTTTITSLISHSSKLSQNK